MTTFPTTRTIFRKKTLTLAEVLKTAGYRCGGIGKWSLGVAGSTGRATSQGFDRFLGYLDQDHAHYYFPEYLDDDEGRLELPDNPTTRKHYSHDLLTDCALQFIEASKDGPFFFYGAYTVPHFSHPSECSTKFAVPSDEPYSDREWDQASKNYAAMITRLDGDVGRIVELIHELGLAEKTLIVFTSDKRRIRRGSEAISKRGTISRLQAGIVRGRNPRALHRPMAGVGFLPGQVTEEVHRLLGHDADVRRTGRRPH